MLVWNDAESSEQDDSIMHDSSQGHHNHNAPLIEANNQPYQNGEQSQVINKVCQNW